MAGEGSREAARAGLRVAACADCPCVIEQRRVTLNDMPMSNPPHPGLSVRHDCLEPLGLSVSEAAAGLGVSRKQLSNIVNGRAGVSPEMAIRLDKAFGGGADAWYRLQAAYDIAQAKKTASGVRVKRRGVRPGFAIPA